MPVPTLAFPSLTPVFRRVLDAYSRNEVVALPTLAGNAVMAPVGALCKVLIGNLTGHDRMAEAAAFMIPVLLGGALAGAPFLPIAHLFEERRREKGGR